MLEVVIRYTNGKMTRFKDIIQVYTDGAMLTLENGNGKIMIDRLKIDWFYIPYRTKPDPLTEMIENCVISFEGEEE